MIGAVGPIRLRDGKARMYFPAGCERLTPRVMAARDWEPDASRWLIGGLRHGDCFLDVGAHVGYYTVLASKAVGCEGRVYAFEPDPENFELLGTNVLFNGLKNVHAFKAAVSNRCGNATLYRSQKNSGDHRIAADGDRESVAVEQVALDVVLAGQRIDAIKIDTQGAEVHVLEGMRKLLAKQGRIRMLIEFWPYGLERMGRSAGELLNLLIHYRFPVKVFEMKALLSALTVENRKHTNLLLERAA